MPYTQGDALGGISAGTLTTAATLVSGGNPIVAVSSGILSSLFGGSGDDAQRDARAEWFAQGVRQGSPYAAGVMYGAQNNVSANEWNKNWSSRVNALAGDPRYSMLMAYGSTHKQWDSHDDRWSSGMRATVENEVEQLQAQQRLASPAPAPIVLAPPSSMTVPTSLPTRTVQGLPAMTSTAPYNYTPLIIGGGAAVALVLLSNNRKRR